MLQTGAPKALEESQLADTPVPALTHLRRQSAVVARHGGTVGASDTEDHAVRRTAPRLLRGQKRHARCPVQRIPIVAEEAMVQVPEVMKRLARDDAGQGMAEYALLAGLIAVVAIAAVTLLGTNIKTTLNNIATAISGS